MDGEKGLNEEISNHVLSFYKDLFSKEDWIRPTLENLEFKLIDDLNADFLEKAFV